MTEAEARAALAAFDGLGGLERWIAGQPWEPAMGGWDVLRDLQGWRFRVEPALGGVRMVASAAGGEPAVWFVPSRPAPAAYSATLERKERRRTAALHTAGCRAVSRSFVRRCVA